MIILALEQFAQILFNSSFDLLIGWQKDLTIIFAVVLVSFFLYVIWRFVIGLFSLLKWW